MKRPARAKSLNMLTKPLPRLSNATRKGAVAVEFAGCLTLLVLFTFSAFEFARLSMVKHTVGTAAYEAARHVMVPGATTAEAKSTAQSVLATVGIRSATVTVSPDPLTDTNSSVTVTVSVPMSQNSWLAPLFSSGKIVKTSVRLVTERPPGVQVNGLVTTPITPPVDPLPVDATTEML